MANKTANVNARVEADVKKKAEGILAKMGIPTSVAINMFYHQIINSHGLPFRPVAPANAPIALDEMTDGMLNARLQHSYEQALAGEGRPMNDVFDDLERNLK